MGNNLRVLKTQGKLTEKELEMLKKYVVTAQQGKTMPELDHAWFLGSVRTVKEKLNREDVFMKETFTGVSNVYYNFVKEPKNSQPTLVTITIRITSVDFCKTKISS